MLRLLAEQQQSIVALCDVDAKYAAHTFKTYPQAEVYRDYRVLFDKRRDIDAVVIATPDHMHAPITLTALRAGRHVYVEKPMAHSIEEARLMTRVAKETGRVTQVGNAGHAGEGLRLTREWISAGIIGAVSEVHCWSDRPGTFWKQDLDRPADEPPVPAELDWDLWLGGARGVPIIPSTARELGEAGSISVRVRWVIWRSTIWILPSTRWTSGPPLRPRHRPASL